MLPLRISHVVNYAPGLSGMYGSVRELHFAEQALGLDARIVDDANAKSFYGDYGVDGVVPASLGFCDEADIICWHHAVHEDWLNEPHRNLVMFLHGTPEFNLFTELYTKDRPFSLIIGAANAGIPKAFVTMWRRHVPIWESLLRTKVEYIPAWVDLEKFKVSTRQPEKDTIRIALVDQWRHTREPFDLFMTIDRLHRCSGLKVKVDVWGLPAMPNPAWQAAIQWLVEADVVTLKGVTQDPMKDIYHQCDLVLTMSSEETRVVREAYACGVPVVCGHDVEFTFRCADAANQGKLAMRVLECHQDLLANPAAMRRDRREYAESRFKPALAAIEAAKIFERVVEEHGSVNHPHFLVKGQRMVKSVKETADELQRRLKDQQGTIYTRFGDGTLLLMNGHSGWDYWHHANSQLQLELTKAFQADQAGYLIGCVAGQENEGRMRAGLFARPPSEVSLRQIAQAHGTPPWHNAVALLYQSVFDPAWFSYFMGMLQIRQVALVCNEQVAASNLVKEALNVSRFIVVPAVDAYKDIDRIYAEVKEAAGSCQVILSAAGPVSNVLGYRLSQTDFIARGLLFLDIGSIADGLAGIESHTWIKLVGERYRAGYQALFCPPMVDIIVLTHGQPETTRRCFASIQRHTRQPYRVIWMDNGSPVEDIRALSPTFEQFQERRLSSFDNNEGYSKAANTGLQWCLDCDPGVEYMVLLNNDTEVTPAWLDHLVGAAVVGDYAAIGPLTSEGNCQSLDALRPVVPDLPAFKDESPAERAKSLWRQYGYRAVQSTNMLSFFCCLLKTSAIREVGPLDENLFCYGEDNDYCLRLARRGHKLGIALGSYVHHDHHVTAAAMGDDWIGKQQAQAVQYLKTKWKNVPADAVVGPAWAERIKR